MSLRKILLPILLVQPACASTQDSAAETVAFGERTYRVRPLFQDSFKNADNWVVEAKGTFTARDGALLWDCDGKEYRGTAWCRRRFRGPTLVTYDVEVLGGRSNINFIFYADLEREGRSALLETTAERDGDYGQYHVFPNTIITYLANPGPGEDANRWRVRFRRNPGFKLLRETFLHQDVPFGTRQNVAYAFEKDGTMRLFVDGKELLSHKEDGPLRYDGYHGLRTWRTKIRYRDFRVYGILEP